MQKMDNPIFLGGLADSPGFWGIGVVLGGRGWSLDPLGFRGVFGSREIVFGKSDYDEK